MNKYLLAFLTVILVAPVYAEQPKVYSKNSVVSDRTLADWSAAWRQWADSMPATKHPLFDTESCDEGNSGPVWFLGGRFCAVGINDCNNLPAVRECVVKRRCTLFSCP